MRTLIDVYCTPEVDPPVLKYVAEAPPCTYTFALESKDACKSTPPGFGNRLNRTGGLAGFVRPH
jgi:hypothetical protein